MHQFKNGDVVQVNYDHDIIITLDEAEYFDEVHSSLHRAGADLIIGYAAEHFIRWRAALSVSPN